MVEIPLGTTGNRLISSDFKTQIEVTKEGCLF